MTFKRCKKVCKKCEVKILCIFVGKFQNELLLILNSGLFYFGVEWLFWNYSLSFACFLMSLSSKIYRCVFRLLFLVFCVFELFRFWYFVQVVVVVDLISTVVYVFVFCYSRTGRCICVFNRRKTNRISSRGVNVCHRESNWPVPTGALSRAYW